MMINYSQSPDPYRQPMKPEPALFIIKSKHTKLYNGIEQYEFVYFPIDPRDKSFDPEYDGDPNWIYMMQNPRDASVGTYGGCMINIMHLDRPKDYEIVPRNKWVKKWVEPEARPFWEHPNFKKTLPVVADQPKNPFKTNPKPNPFERLAKSNPFETVEAPKKPSFLDLFKKKNI